MTTVQGKSEEVFRRSCEKIPGGVNSPVRAFSGLSINPMIVDSGKGSRITDIDGREFIDYCCSWGPLIHGHCHPKIIEGVKEQLEKGTSFGISTEIELELAEKIVDWVPPIEKIRFVSSGTEATMTALRLARGYTGKNIIIKFSGNYHGHADSLLVQAGSHVSRLNSSATSGGVLEDTIKNTLCFEYNDSEAILRFFQENPLAKNVAAIIVEPVACNMGVVPAKASFLKTLREVTKTFNAVLIFDEVITGFRLGLKGALDVYPVEPDLICYGKVIGGGFPVGAFGGSSEIMNCLAPLGSVYQAGTLSGNPVAMRAGIESLKLLEQPGFFQALEEKTNRITGPVKKALASKKACLQQVGSLFTIFFGVENVESKNDQKNLDPVAFQKFFQRLYEKGIYLPPSQQEAWFVSSAHTNEDLTYTSNCILEFIDEYY